MNRIRTLPLLLALVVLAACTPANNLLQTAVAGTLNAPVSVVSTATAPFAPSLTCSDTPPGLTPTASGTPSPNPLGLLRVYFVDVGQGDSELILAPDGGIVLIDGGEPDSGILPFLRDHGITRIDLMIASHPHSDHIGGLVQVLESMPVARVVSNGQLSTTTTYEHFLDAVAQDKAAFIIIKRGDALDQGLLNFSVLSPADTPSGDLNNNSLVLRLAYGRISFLFMGDADRAAEAGILSAGLAVTSTILKVGHHGSDSASDPAFLAQVNPAMAVYSAGVGNPYGHPSPITLTDLAAVGSQIFGTDVNGTVLVTTDGTNYQVLPDRSGSRLPAAGLLPTITP